MRWCDGGDIASICVVATWLARLCRQVFLISGERGMQLDHLLPIVTVYMGQFVACVVSSLGSPGMSFTEDYALWCYDKAMFDDATGWKI